MSRPRTTLRDLLESAAKKRGTDAAPASSSYMARTARDAGYKIVHTTVASILAGTYPARPKRQTLEAIAWLAGVPIEAAFEAAGLNAPANRFADRITDELDELSAEHQDVVLRVARALLKAQRAVEKQNDGSIWSNLNPDQVNSAQASVAYVTDQDYLNPDELNHMG